jgi:tetratricopeptide (TPR) repeat protein/predicted aspartyl protease
MVGRFPLIATILMGALGSALPAFAACKLDLVAQMPVTMQGLQPVVDARINGVEAHLLVDYGSSFSVISRSHADRFHLKIGVLPANITVRGVNGVADMGLATASNFTFVGANFPRTQFLVGGSEDGPTIDGVLGRNFLMAADSEIDLANGVIKLIQPKGCGYQPLAYWAPPGSGYAMIPLDPRRSSTDQVVGTAEINGQPMKVELASGSADSILTQSAAGRAGIRRDGPGVTQAGLVIGEGRKSIESWIAPVASFKIGGEEIKNTRLRVAAIDLGDNDMLIGADFMLSHHIFLARSQDRLYFTYNGGPVFRLVPEQDGPPGPQVASAAAPPAASSDDEPKDAAGFARRGDASAARREYAQAIADFSRAMELDPKDPQLPYDRAMARLGNRQLLLALSDLDQALKLQPDFTLALLARGRLKLANRDPDGAKADFEAAARLDPTLRLQIAEAYENTGLDDQAIDRFSQWIDANPKDERLAEALNGRCWSRALMGRELDQALADCDRALKLRPGMAEIMDSRGLVHLRLGQYGQAIADYDEALRLRPKQPWSLYGRGVARLKLGQVTDGQADLEAATAIAPAIAARAKARGIGPEMQAGAKS